MLMTCWTRRTGPWQGSPGQWTLILLYAIQCMVVQQWRKICHQGCLTYSGLWGGYILVYGGIYCPKKRFRGPQNTFKPSGPFSSLITIRPCFTLIRVVWNSFGSESPFPAWDKDFQFFFYKCSLPTLYSLTSTSLLFKMLSPGTRIFS